jgi:UDPglucose 6-dehydrogenase
MICGAGRLGAPLAAILAANKTHVTVVDIDERTVNLLNQGKAPVEETGLDELLELAHPWLRATTDINQAVADTDIALVVVPTPSDSTGRFSNRHVIEAVEQIGRALALRTDEPDFFTLVVVSTVMPGSIRGPITDAFEAASGRTRGIDCSVVFSPAFIALGSVIRDFTHPDVVLIGADDEIGPRYLRRLLTKVIENEPAWHTLSSVDAEIAKLSLNCSVVAKIALANTIGEFCESVPGADAHAVTRAVGSDSRIGSRYFQVGAGAGGACFPRDLVAFVAAAEEMGVDVPLMKAVHEVNERQALRIAGKVVDDKRVGILGLTFKPNTPVTEASLGVKLVEILTEWDVAVETFDPAAGGTMKSAADVVEWADAVVVATPWSEFAGLDYGDTRVIDVWSVLPPEENIERIGVSE